MNIDFISSIKELFFDIIGYFIPGFIVLFLINTVYDFSLPFNLDSYESLLLSYVIGYVVYSFSLQKSYLLCKYPKIFYTKSKDQIGEELLSTETIILASKYINAKFEKDGFKLEKINTLRDVAMSQQPDSDKKIYTFMFRAELFDQLHTISIIALLNSLVMLILSLLKLYPQYILDDYFVIGVLIILILTLRQGWKKFYKIAMSLPFSIYISNQSHNDAK